MITSKTRLRWNALLIALVLAFIWGNSLLPGAVSQAVSDGLKTLLGLPLSAGVQSGGRDLIRKAAHFSEFAALGWLLGWRMAMKHRNVGVAAMLGIAAACVDETIQIFAPDRGPGLADVLLDSCGVLAGIAVLHLGHTLYKSLQRNRFGGQDK